MNIIEGKTEQESTGIRLSKGKTETKSEQRRVRNFANKWGTLLAIALVIGGFSYITPYFFSFDNFMDVIRSVCIVTLLGIGITFSLTTNGFDVSVGSIAGLATILSAVIMVWFNFPVIVAIIVPLLVGVVIGLWNSLIVEKFKVPDILATLSSLFIFQGVLITLTKGSAVYNNMKINGVLAPGKIDKAFFMQLGQGNVLGIPILVIIVVIVAVIAHLFLNYTKYGRFMYMTGGNREAARLSGINVVKYRVLSYAISGFCAALGGVLLAARTGIGEVNAGAPLLMDAVAAAYIGFSVLGKAKPNIFGTFVGAVFMGILLNGLTMINVKYYTQDIVKGAVLVAALCLTFSTSRHTQK